MKFGRNTGFKWNQREELKGECISGLDVWGKHVRRVICKGLDMIEGAFHALEIRICVI